jgi:hypothetical protein
MKKTSTKDPKPETPLPFWQIFTVCVIQLCEAVNGKLCFVLTVYLTFMCFLL